LGILLETSGNIGAELSFLSGLTIGKGAPEGGFAHFCFDLLKGAIKKT
jgi:hypothetical protein